MVAWPNSTSPTPASTSRDLSTGGRHWGRGQGRGEVGSALSCDESRSRRKYHVDWIVVWIWTDLRKEVRGFFGLRYVTSCVRWDSGFLLSLFSGRWVPHPLDLEAFYFLYWTSLSGTMCPSDSPIRLKTQQHYPSCLRKDMDKQQELGCAFEPDGLFALLSTQQQYPV